MSVAAYDVEQQPWDNFVAAFAWKQGEHVSLIGPTGHGKTTLAGYLLESPPVGRFRPHSRHPYWKSLKQPPLENVEAARPYTVIFANKRRDETAEKFLKRGYIRMSEWRDITPEFHPDVYPRRILWPPAGRMGKLSSQRRIFEKAIDKIAAEEGWTLYIDDAIYVADQEMLRLRPEYRDSLYRLRSSGITIISGIQRPSGVPRELYSQVRHIFFWHTNDEADLDRIQGIGGLSGKQLRSTVQRLDFHEALYVDTQTERMVRTQTPE